MKDLPPKEAPAVFDFIDYRDYLKLKIAYMQKTGAYSSRSFAKQVGFGSAGFLRMIMDGKRRLTPESLKKIIPALSLSKNEAAYFKTLVQFNDAEGSENKERYYAELIKIRQKLKLKTLVLAEYHLLSRWYVVALLEALGTSWRNKTDEQMGQALGLKAEQVTEALQVLKNLGIVEWTNEGWKKKNLIFETPELAKSESIERLHREMLRKAEDSIREVEESFRSLMGLTIALSKSQFDQVRDRLFQTLTDLNAEYSDAISPEGIFQVNFQIFPLLRFQEEEKLKPARK